MEHYAPLPCDACNYGTYTPFSKQGGTSFPQPELNSLSPMQTDDTPPAHHSLAPKSAALPYSLVLTPPSWKPPQKTLFPSWTDITSGRQIHVRQTSTTPNTVPSRHVYLPDGYSAGSAPSMPAFAQYSIQITQHVKSPSSIWTLIRSGKAC